jgi:hypothetical protein
MAFVVVLREPLVRLPIRLMIADRMVDLSTNSRWNSSLRAKAEVNPNTK